MDSDKSTTCYLCGSTTSRIRKGQVRDMPQLKVLECRQCGLVRLSSQSHITEKFYENSGMHGADPTPLEEWLKSTEKDDQRRFEALKSMLPNKRLLDFGCGAGGFLRKAWHLAGSVAGVELEVRVQEYWRNQMTIYPDIATVRGSYDLITAFHVVEHLADPISMIKDLAEKLDENGCMVIEVPSSEDALLTFYESDAFQHFTYWSQHLYLFNPETLKQTIMRAGLQIESIKQCQRYPLSNHLYWLSRGLPGGHQHWSFLDSPELNAAYANALAALGKCDTIVAYLKRAT